MYKLGDSVDRDIFTHLIRILEDKPLSMNLYRSNSGDGRSQAFGISKQRTNQYAGSSQNYRRMDLFKELLRIAEKILPEGYVYHAIQLNQNYETAPHKDKGNRGNSAIIGFGSYEGGELVIEDSVVDIRHRLVFFDGCIHTHYTKPFKGDRYSLVFYQVDREFCSLPQWDFCTHEKQTFLAEILDGLTIWYNKNGDKMWDDTWEWKPKQQRRPTFRILKEVSKESLTSSSPLTTQQSSSPRTL